MANETIIRMRPDDFPGKERLFATYGGIQVSLFRYPSGVRAVRLRQDRGEIVMLPFQGQQIWEATFDGRSLKMGSMFEHPRPTRQYLENYGAFLLHCGITGMGNPSEEDTHPLHGELPNAPYQEAHLALGEDERGRYVSLEGRYRHRVAMTAGYVAEARVRLYEGATLLPIRMQVTNLRQQPLELMYMAHVNFRPVDGSRLLDTVSSEPGSVVVRTSMPEHVRPHETYLRFLEDLQKDPTLLHEITPELPLDPEVVLMLSYEADDDGWAHSLQVHPDGGADYIRHRPDQLDHGVRWVVRTGDEDALGLALPATAGPEGYHREKAKGNIRVVAAGETVRFDIEAGHLAADEVPDVEAAIAKVNG